MKRFFFALDVFYWIPVGFCGILLAARLWFHLPLTWAIALHAESLLLLLVFGVLSFRTHRLDSASKEARIHRALLILIPVIALHVPAFYIGGALTRYGNPWFAPIVTAVLFGSIYCFVAWVSLLFLRKRIHFQD